MAVIFFSQLHADDVTTASKMTFHCEDTPSSAILVNIVRIEST